MNKITSLIFGISFVAILIFFSMPGWAGEPSNEPILRIETGMHITVISRIGVDAANRYLVTGSSDKTIRLWDLATGTLLKTLRPPIGPGNEGIIYAVAISPDGQIIAAAGNTGGSWDGKGCIYLFDRTSGRIVNRITGLPSFILHLAYSKDGRFLVAALRGNGIRIYKAIDYSIVGEDKDYGNASSCADFDIGGRLVTASIDGFIRLYDKDFKLIAKEKVPGGNRPDSVSFAPDGLKVAVGFDDTPKVDVLSGQDLTYLYSPDTSDRNKDVLYSVSWSADGKFIYAAGSYGKNTGVIRKWSKAGKGTYIDLMAADNNIFHIMPLINGGIVFSTFEPAFGVFDSDDRENLHKESDIANYRENQKGFLISNDGTTIQFGYEKLGKSPARFSMADCQIQLEPDKDISLVSSLISGEELKITWKDTSAPKLNGKPLILNQRDVSRYLAIAHNQESFLLGTEWCLRLFDKTGIQIWSITSPGVARGVNISGNDKLAVAAFSDGTIRWYRLKDGKELLALFPHKDKKRWVLWTPSGYYDCSPGGEELIGWHVNNGKDNAADFFPASKFRSIYYRPDVVERVLDALDEAEAVRIANEMAGRAKLATSISQMLPPVVSIISPTDGAEVSANEITVKFSIRTPSGEPVIGIKALVDGRPVANQRGITIVPKDKDVSEMKIAIPARDSEISIIAENKYCSSEPAIVRIKWAGKPPADEFAIKPKLYVLAVGISKYENKDIPQLGLAAKDARDFAEAMLKQKDGIYRDVVTKVLTDEKATKDEILDGLDWLSKETTSKDVAMVFLAGHGVNDQNGVYYFLSVNAIPDKLKRTGVAFSDIKTTVESIAGKTILFVDTCHSGNVMGTRRGAADINAVVNELSSAENGAVVFASSSGKQYSLEDPAWGNGAFTKALIEGISGKADYAGKGRITINMLDLYLSERVKELTKGKQTPTTTKPQTVADFPIALKQ